MTREEEDETSFEEIWDRDLKYEEPDYAMCKFWFFEGRRTLREKQKQFLSKFSSQDIPAKFQKLIDENFWDLV